MWCLDAVIDGIREAQYPDIDFQVKNIFRDEGKHMKVPPIAAVELDDSAVHLAWSKEIIL